MEVVVLVLVVPVVVAVAVARAAVVVVQDEAEMFAAEEIVFERFEGREPSLSLVP